MAPQVTLEMIQKRVKDDRMDLSSLRLEQVPLEMICRCASSSGARITELDLSNNVISLLPPHFCSMFPSIEKLNLEKNRISRLPENFGRLSSLKWLNLSHNKIKRLPESFANLEVLEWLNLSDNSLERDLAEVIGKCSNDLECSSAANDAVQYVYFSSSLNSAAVIADSTHVQDDSSDSNQDQDNSELRMHEFQKQQRSNKQGKNRIGQPAMTHMEEQLIDENEVFRTSNSASRFSSNITIVLILLAILAVGVPLWLTLDSIRENCMSEIEVKKQSQVEHRFCAQISQTLSGGKMPTSIGQFIGDFASIFRDHWVRAVNRPLMEKISSSEFTSPKWLIERIVFYGKFVAALMEPIFEFFASYFTHLWRQHIIPLMGPLIP